MRWQPHVTVAAVIEQDNQFLLVEENIDNQLMLNQPAGHWENGETLIEAVIRETLEETAWHFVPEFLIGIYQWQHPTLPEETYLRFAFTGSLLSFEKNRQLDNPIVRTVWQDYEELLHSRARHRSPQLLLCVDDYLQGKRYPIECLIEVKS
ncbi:MAG: NUDIX hydrolase [Gammaproteobacteria bacterium]|nr:NUDIX hydrolase [Gammaproteobacteria bacterium]